MLKTKKSFAEKLAICIPDSAVTGKAMITIQDETEIIFPKLSIDIWTHTQWVPLFLNENYPTCWVSDEKVPWEKDYEYCVICQGYTYMHIRRRFPYEFFVGKDVILTDNIDVPESPVTIHSGNIGRVVLASGNGIAKVRFVLESSLIISFLLTLNADNVL